MLAAGRPGRTRQPDIQQPFQSFAVPINGPGGNSTTIGPSDKSIAKPA